MSYQALSPSGRVIHCKTYEEAQRVEAWSAWVIRQRHEAPPPKERPAPEPETGICAAPLPGRNGEICHYPVSEYRPTCPVHGAGL